MSIQTHIASTDTAQLRVLHVITRITNGGSERRLIDALSVKAEHSVITGEKHLGPNLDRILENSPVSILPSLRREISPANDIRAVLALCSRIRSESVDILHSHQSKSGVLCRAAIAMLPRKHRPRLIHSLSMASFGNGYGRVKSTIFKQLEQKSHQWVDEYLVVGSDLAESYRDIGVPDHKLKCVRSSLELQPFWNSGRIRSFEEKPVRILFVGSLDMRKGVSLLPDFIDAIKNSVPVELYIAGEGPLSSDIQNRIDRHDLPIKLLGYRNDIPELMASADLLVLPSLVEGLPQVLVQAAANQLPFITFEVHGARELISLGGDGVICTENSVSSLVDAFFQRINNDGVCNRFTLPVHQWNISSVADQIFHSYRSSAA